MTPQPSQNPVLSLEPATLTAMLRTTIDTLPHHPDAPEAEQAIQRQAAFEIIAALHPRDALEALLASRLVAAHYHAMDAFRCAAQRDLPINLLLRYQGKAIALSRLMATTLRDLNRRQAGPALQPEALPAPVPAARAQPAPSAAHTPAQPPPAEGRHERRRRERAERHLVAVVQAAGLGTGAHDHAMSQRLHAEVAARAAASTTALAA